MILRRPQLTLDLKLSFLSEIIINTHYYLWSTLDIPSLINRMGTEIHILMTSEITQSKFNMFKNRKLKMEIQCNSIYTKASKKFYVFRSRFHSPTSWQ